MRTKPKIGDYYVPEFESDINKRLYPYDMLTIEEIGQEWDGSLPNKWYGEIKASDKTWYDCIYSEKYDVWCYGL